MKTNNIKLSAKRLNNTGLTQRQINVVLAGDCYLSDSSHYKEVSEYSSTEVSVLILGTDVNCDWKGILVIENTPFGEVSYLFESNLACVDWTLTTLNNTKNEGVISQNTNYGIAEVSVLLPCEIFTWLVERLKDKDYVTLKTQMT